MPSLEAAPPEWRVNDVCLLASVSTALCGSDTLGVAVGPRQFFADQPLARADVFRAMHQRVQLCQDSQTESALLRESLGVSRINHIRRVHGHTLLSRERQAAEIFVEVGKGPMRDPFKDSQRTAWNKPRSVPAVTIGGK